MSEEKYATLDRRAMLAMTAGAITAGIAGCARGASPAYTSAAQANSRRRFARKVVLVTGATSGIGRAAAIAFAAEGAKVAFCGRREHLGQKVESAIRSHLWSGHGTEASSVVGGGAVCQTSVVNLKFAI